MASSCSRRSANLSGWASCLRLVSASRSVTAPTWALGTTTMPSALAQTISPGWTITPPQHTGTLISPGPIFGPDQIDTPLALPRGGEPQALLGRQVGARPAFRRRRRTHERDGGLEDGADVMHRIHP